MVECSLGEIEFARHRVQGQTRQASAQEHPARGVQDLLPHLILAAFFDGVASIHD